MMNEAPYGNFARWVERSPLTSVARVKTPCLIFQGEKDPIVPIGQSQEFYRALRYFKVPTRLVVYPDEPHGLSVPSYQRDKMQREFEWIDKYLRATTATSR
jgi:dipeptidyl aminopeptidase/acylaminoacyl peptidase